MKRAGKLACKCGHGKAIHYDASIFKEHSRNRCNFPGCKCKRYRFDRIVKTR